MTTRLQRLVPLLVLGLGGISCVDDLGPEPKAEPVALALRVTLPGLSSAVTYTVNVQVSYQIVGGGSGLLDITRPTFQITGGAPPDPQRIGVDLTRCLEDATRVDADADGCRLSVTLILTDGMGELAQATQDLGLVRDGDQVEPAEPIEIRPNFLLAITGGGPGTGSGSVSVPATDGQGALSCQITDGQASATGCSGRYPIHTSLTLTASGATLEAWDVDCAAAAAPGPCQLTMDGHRTAKARFAPAPTTGELEVQVSGLPAGIAAQVTVANTTGFSRPVTETTVLTGLIPGEYTVTATAVPVATEEQTYSPDPPQQTVTIVAGQRATAQIGYNPPETGSLAVAITGLPEGTDASVTVAGPGNFNRSLTASETLSGLVPGSYTVTALSVTGAGGQAYDPVVTPQQPIVVEAGSGATVAVTYSVPPATQLVFTQQPTNAVSGAAISPPVSVEVRDAQGRPVPSYVTRVTLSLQGGAAEARLTGNTSVPQNGVAVFNDLSVDLVGTGYSLLANSGNLPGSTSTSFAVTAGPVSPDRSTIEVSPAVLRTCCGTSTVTVTARDLNGNPIPGATVRLVATGVGDTLTQPSAPTDGNGIAIGEFASRTIGTKIVSAIINDIPLTATASVEVTAGITFTMRVLRNQEIFVANADGSDLFRVTTSTAFESEPAWSPDGSKIAFSANTGNVYVMSANGSDTVNVVENATSPAWSPDGSSIAFSAQTCDECEFDIFILNLSVGGSTRVNLTEAFDSDASMPAWSPDGAHIAFTGRVCGEGCQQDVFVMRIDDGLDPVNLTVTDSADEFAAAWSPDGGKIAFSTLACPEGCQYDVEVISANGSDRDNLTDDFADALLPAWSPDGLRIAFSLLLGGIYVMNPDGSFPTPLIANGFDPNWR